MTRAPDTDVDVFADLEAVSQAAAEACVAAAQEATRAHGTFALGLTGGNTPERLYQLLAGPYADQMPWPAVHFFWSDERYVPPEDDASNHGMARMALLDHVDVPESQIHPFPTGAGDPQADAADYEETLRAFAAGRPDGAPLLDFLLLGMGGDGHICSLFPEDLPFEEDAETWVCAPYGPPRHQPRQRLSLTLAAIAEAEDALFLVSGDEKREAVQAVLGEHDAARPATHMHVQRRIRWFLDEAAAADIA